MVQCICKRVSVCRSVAHTLQVVNTSVENDFFSSSVVVSFTSGETSADAVLLLRNDALPEGNETFIVNITGME